MSEESFRKTYYQSDFTSLAGGIGENLSLLETTLLGLVLTVPVNEVRLSLGGSAAIVEWQTLPLEADVDLVDAAVAAFVGGTTTSSPFSVLSAGVTTAANATLVDKIDFETPPLDAGTYSITYTGQQRLQTAAAGDSAGVRLTITFSGFPAFFQEDEWPFVLDHAYNYAVTGQVLAGQTIRVQAQVYKLGAGAAIAEVSKARFTVDKIS